MPLHVPVSLSEIADEVWTRAGRVLDPNNPTSILGRIGDPTGHTLATLVAKLGNPAAAIGALLENLDNAVFEEEWITDPVVENKASAAEQTLATHTIAAVDFVYPSGASEVRVILLAMITAAAQADPTNPHHIGLKVQREINDGGWADLKNFTANPPLALAADGAMGPWSFPIDISALVASGDKLEFRFAVDSDDAASVNYTTSFLVVLVYTMG